ncbi:hypothetical protein [Inhella gelatinilytica]|uniref:Uncharacterized protein n=1 Tax=Inhella gelatinilytica TaxID=2795030 RepID=A0A931IVY8_9BURK|nr:hypothetical protein [Inhella gelatinilytica]MBH9552566.1 hypothetical protein [Inhella gelatinilytica]
MRALRWRRWLIAAGFVALLLITIAVVLGPATPEDRAAYAPKPVWSVEPAAAATPAAAASAANTSTETPAVRWREAYRRNYSLTLRQRVHQARVSGALQDIVATYQMARECDDQAQFATLAIRSGSSYAELAKGWTAAQRERVQRYVERCEGAREARKGEFRLLDAGPDSKAAVLLIRVFRGQTLKAEERLAAIAFAQSQGSAALLAGVMPHVWTVPFDWIGWSSSTLLEGQADDAMLHKALALAACQEIGNCEQAAQENFLCVGGIGCVDDERRWAETHLLASAHLRVKVFQPHDLEDWARRFENLERWMVAQGLSPAQIREMRRYVLPGCRTTECLQQRWAEAQAFVAALISGKHKPGQPWPP